MGVSIEEMRHRVTLQEAVNTPDGAGGFTSVWNDVATIWAAVKADGVATAKRELFGDGKLESAESYLMTIRYLDEVRHDMRVLFDGRVFDIKSIKQDEIPKRFVSIVLVEIFSSLN